MGGVVNRGKRVLRMYNIDNRVEKVLSKEKPTTAPRYQTDLKSVDAAGKKRIFSYLIN
jgi:hypothetical protein